MNDTATTATQNNVDTLLEDIRQGWDQLRILPTEVQTLKSQMLEARRLAAASIRSHIRPAGGLSHDAAAALAGHFILHCERCGRMEALAATSEDRDKLLSLARSSLGISARAAITTGEVLLPSNLIGSEIRELISEFGVARKKMTHYPIGRGTARPPRMGTRPAFASISMSGAFPEKVPSITFASLESHKVGGLVRVPREIDEQSAVAMGQFLGRYGAIEFARAEDTWAFLADGQPGYDGVRGVVQISDDTLKTISLATGKTKPSDATITDLRALRANVNKAALSGSVGAYYFDTTWEAFLVGLNTTVNPNIYIRTANGTLLDGYPIVWTDVLQPYGTTAAAAKPIAVFGALSYWWFGEHGTPRMDTSEHVYYANDQLAVRFIEEIDFDYVASDAAAALKTAAS